MRVEGLASREKIQADKAPDDDDGHPQVPVEVLLDVQGVVAAGDAIA